MQIKQRKSTEERLVVIGMIMSPGVLSEIAAQWDKSQGGMFRARWGNLIARWCLEHWENHKEAPKKTIQVYFDTWAKKHSKDEATINLVEKLLGSLSEQFEADEEVESINVEYVLKVAAKQFNVVRLQRVIEVVEQLIEIGEVEQADETIHAHTKIQYGIRTNVNFLNEVDSHQNVFEEEERDLFTYPGDLGAFFRGELTRDAFLAFLAPEKRGKTWWMIDMALRAVKSRRRVAFFSVGDLTEVQMLRRMYIAVSGHPWKASTILYPDKFRYIENMGWVNDRVQRVFDQDLSWQISKRSCDRLLKRFVRSKHSYFKLFTAPAGTFSVDDIRGALSRTDDEFWTPDVIMVDYADILCPKRGLSDMRERINNIWMDLRALSQERKALVVTATQANAKSYDAHSLTRNNFAEDKRKFAHVTSMIGINQTPTEKQSGVFRLNQILSREGTLSEYDQVVVGGCLSIGRPAIKSKWDDSRKMAEDDDSVQHTEE